MFEMRKMGLSIKQHAEKTDQSFIAEVLNCTKEQISDLFTGRYFLSFEQMEKLATLLKVQPDVFFEDDDVYYNSNVVHCMKPFSNNENREKILDFIDIYIDAYQAVREY